MTGNIYEIIDDIVAFITDAVAKMTKFINGLKSKLQFVVIE